MIVPTLLPPASGGRPATPPQHEVPLVAALRDFARRKTLPFSTPGHKLGVGLDPEIRDLVGDRFPAADVWLNTADLDRAVREAETLAAAAWGADRSFFLVNGSTVGNLALLLATIGPGDEVVVGRDVHQSLLAALILTGASPVWVTPRIHAETGLGLGLDPGAVADALDDHPAARLAVVTSPTSWGVASDLATTVAVAHARGVPVHVDEAWGSHFPFHPALPRSAMACGADSAVTSPHKLLSGLSQAALLNLRGNRLPVARVGSAIRLLQTTSPLLPVLASLDACRRQMALAGRDLLDLTLELAEMARGELEAIAGVSVVDHRRLGLPADRFDPTRLIVDFTGLGLSGHEAERRLRTSHGIAPEMSDPRGVVFLVSIGDTPESIGRLVRAVRAVARGGPGAARAVPPSLDAATITPGEQHLIPRDAWFAASRAVPLAAAEGRVAAEPVIPYPPGIPVLTPGEVVSKEKLACLRDGLATGMHLRGTADPRLHTLRVVDLPGA